MKNEAEKKLEPLINEIIKAIDPISTRASIVVIVSPPANEDQGEYAIFGNLPKGKNQEMVRKVAIDMAMKDLSAKVEQMVAEEELKDATVN